MSPKKAFQFFRKPTKRLTAIAFVIGFLLVSFVTGNVAGYRTAQAINTPALVNASSQYGKVPLSFIANAGQTDAAVRFQVRSKGGLLFFEPTGVTLNLPVAANSVRPPGDKTLNATSSAQVALHLNFEGANANSLLDGVGLLPGIANFFIGNDPSQWYTNVPTYSGIVYHDLYPGVDLQYSGHPGLLKGTYSLTAGVDPSIIRWRYNGADHIAVDPATGNLLISGASGVMLSEQAPVAWQERNGAQVAAKLSYALAADGTIGFALPKDGYDPALPLTIDPGLDYSTYLGGSNTDASTAIAADAGGDAYVTGYTLSTNFPTHSGYQSSFGGVYDAFVSKLNAIGTALVYSTYLGGSGFDEAAGIAVDASNNAYITGFTSSSNFPSTGGAYETSYTGSQAAFVTKLNAAGNGLVYSTFLGGTNFDYGYAIALDSSGSAYVTGQTAGSFPTTSGAFQTSFGGGTNDAFVTKLNAAGSGLVYSTYVGGSDFDQATGIAVDTSGNASITGQTASTDFPTHNAFQGAASTNSDAYVTRLNAAGTGLVYSSYLGGSQYDQGTAVAVDSSGALYVTGYTQSTDFPTTSGSYQTTFAGAQAVFVTKVSSAGSLVYSTFIGGNLASEYDYGFGIGVDSSGNAYITGQTSGGFSTTIGAYQTTSSGGFDAFITKFKPDGSTILYSTYLGGTGSDSASGLALDSIGDVYVTGSTSGGSFPTSSGAAQTSYGGGQDDAFVSEFTLSVQPRIDSIGVYRNGTYLLRLHNSTGFADITFNFNPATKPYPIVGDWFGVGYDTAGVYDQSNGKFTVCVANDASTCANSGNTAQFVLGNPNDVPLSGRWISGAIHVGGGVFRPSNGLIYLKNNLTTGFADYQMVLGIPGDVGLAGDWNGDGIDSPGVYRSSTIGFYLTDQICNCSTFGAYQFQYGVAGDAPVVGDWIGQGHDGVGLFRQSNGFTYLRNSLTTGYADITFVYGIAGDVPVAGHWQAIYPP